LLAKHVENKKTQKKKGGNMKKFLLPLIGIVLMFSLVLPATSVEAAPVVQEYPLYAGQTILVGHVEVTNDTTNIYVRFFVDVAPWVLVDSHIEVATSLAGISQAKGNPIPGKFRYTGNPATIPLGSWAPGTELIIAAHATVMSLSGDGLTWQWATQVLDYKEGTQQDGNPISDPNEPTEALGAPDGSFYSLGFDGWLTIGFGHPLWIGENPWASKPYARYVRTVEITMRPYPLEQVEVWAVVNGVPAYYLGINDNQHAWGDGSGVWQSYLVYLPNLNIAVDGIMLKDTSSKLDFLSYPTEDGFDVDAVATKFLVDASNSAWASEVGGGHAFPGKNWATYFHYTVQAP
jgi:hypothetical protein